MLSRFTLHLILPILLKNKKNICHTNIYVFSSNIKISPSTNENVFYKNPLKGKWSSLIISMESLRIVL